MKKLLVAAALAFFASTASAAIVGTPHDLTAGSTVVPLPGVCQYCHMPHNANTAVTVAPIWSRTVNAATAYQTNATLAINLGATQYSLLCLSCHDGTIATGTLWNNTNLNSTRGLIPNTSANYIGTVLTNDHPVGLIYPAGGTAAAASGLDTRANAIGHGFAFFGAAGDYMECSSCHDPHDNTRGRFLRLITGDFCAGCHALK
jgi:predicted CXXCH cytochrome family protein